MSRFMSYWTARTVVEFLCFSRYSCKLFLYLATGRQFRKNLLKLVFKCNKQLRNKYDSTNVTSRHNLAKCGQGAEHVKLLLREGKLSPNRKVSNNNLGSSPSICGLREPRTELLAISDETLAGSKENIQNHQPAPITTDQINTKT